MRGSWHWFLDCLCHRRAADSFARSRFDVRFLESKHFVKEKPKKKTRRRGSGKKITIDAETTKEKSEDEISSNNQENKTSEPNSNLTDSETKEKDS